MSYGPNSTLRERTFDRLKKSIAGEQTDAHAVFHYYTFPFYHFVTGVPLDRYFHDPKTMFDTQLEVLERLEKCGSFQPDPGPVAECSGLGGKVRFDKEGFISVAPSGIECIEDIVHLEPGDPYGDNYMRVALETLEYMVDHAPKDIKVNPPISVAPFTVAAQLRGIGDFCADALEDPDFARALLEITTETCIRFIRASEKVMGAPIHHILMSDDLSSFLNTSLFEELVMPCYQKIMAQFPQTEFWLHNDAQAKHLCKLIADSGFKAWQYAPSVDPLEAMADIDIRMSLLGGMSPLKFQHISAQETYDICIETLKTFGGNNKFVLGVGGSVNQVPIENLMAMFHAADDYKI